MKAILATILLALAYQLPTTAAPEPAKYIPEKSEEVGTLDVKPTANVRLSIPQLTIEVPAGATTVATKITLFKETGTLKLNSGIPSGEVFRFQTGNTTSYETPVEISVTPDKALGMPIGYAITDHGRLEPLQFKSVDRKSNTWTWVTFKPIRFTWVYSAKKP